MMMMMIIIIMIMMMMFLSWINILSFKLPSISCYMPTSKTWDYIDTLIITTLLPIAASVLLLVVGVLQTLSLRRRRDTMTALHMQKEARRISSQYITLFLLLTYLVLPSVSTSIAAAIPCVNIDPSNVQSGVDNYYMQYDSIITS